MESLYPDNDSQFFFCHIPKTAGVTLGNVLEDHFPADQVLDQFSTEQGYLRTVHLVNAPLEQLTKYRLIKGHIFYDAMLKVLPQTPVSLTMFRRPIARTLSIYGHIRARPQHPLHEDANALSLMECLEIRDFAKMIANVQSRHLGYQYPDNAFESWQAFMSVWRIEYEDACAKEQEVLERAKQNLPEFAFFGLTERFDDSLALLSYRFGWRPVERITRQNVTPDRPEREKMPDETLRRVEEMNAADQVFYEYAAELFEERFRQMTESLLEEYGTREHAGMSYPLPHETLLDLLNRRYERLFRERNRPVDKLFYTFDQPMEGTGWYPRQPGTEGGMLRWTGPDTVSTIDLPLASNRDLRIQVCVQMALSDDILNSLEIRVNDWPLDLNTRKDLKTQTIFEGVIPQNVLNNGRSYARMTFEVERTESPEVLAPWRADRQHFGVRVAWIRINPLDLDEEEPAAWSDAGGFERLVHILRGPAAAFRRWVAGLGPRSGKDDSPAESGALSAGPSASKQPESGQVNEVTRPAHDADCMFFIHIPKTAGTTLRNLLLNQFPEEAIAPVKGNFQELLDTPAIIDHLAEYRFVSGHYYYNLSQLMPRKPVYLTMLRDPVDRALSLYYYVRRLPEHPRHKEAQEHDVIQFLEMHQSRGYIGDPMVYCIGTDFDVRNREHVERISKGARDLADVDLAIRRLREFEYFGVANRFQDSVFLLAYTFGWWPVTQYQNINVTPDRPRRRQLEPSLADRIRELSEADVALFEFGSGLFDRRYVAMVEDLLAKYGDGAYDGPPEVLPDSALSDLLKKNYGDVNAASYEPVDDLRLTFDQAIDGAGWHHREYEPHHGTFRWTGPSPVATLVLPLARQKALKIRFHVVLWIGDDVLASLRLMIDGQPVDLEKTVEANSIIFEGDIPASAPAGEARFSQLDFVMDRTISPQSLDPSSQDTRELGIAMNWIEIRPR
jgi:hypothetical protein